MERIQILPLCGYNGIWNSFKGKRTMIEIKKGKEPKELLKYRKQENASYASMPSDVKKKVVENLLLEQGHLCAYCMRRIEAEDKKHRTTIEHCTPQAATTEEERLNYKNMVAVCWGNRDAHSNEDKCCDARRGSLKSKEQEMKVLDVFRGSTLTEIKYSADGTIFSDNPYVDEDLNKRLNLNCKALGLKENRKKALAAVQKNIYSRYEKKSVDLRYLQRLLAHYEKQSEYKEPYCGIILAWLNKKIESHKK